MPPRAPFQLTRPTWAVAAALTVLLLAAASPDASAFTPKTRAEIVRRAASLMPDSLQRQLRRHSRSLYTGALSGMTGGEGRGVHAFDPGTAGTALENAISAVTAAVDGQQPMEVVVRRLGEVAHAATDLAFALNIGPDGERESAVYQSFSTYVEEMLPKVRVTFSGFDDTDLANNDVAAFAARVAHDARRDYGAIMRNYFPEGRQPTDQDFDERSIPFAVASVEVSLAVNATAKGWLYAWHEAHGDLDGAPLAFRSEAGPFGRAKNDRTNTDSDTMTHDTGGAAETANEDSR